MEGEGLMNGVLEDPPTAMDVDTDVNDRLPSSQMQDIKALLTALSLLSRSVEVPNKLFRRITSIAQKSDTVDQVFEVQLLHVDHVLPLTGPRIGEEH